MKAVYDLEFPYDVAITTSDNDSLYIVLLFKSQEKAEYFHKTLIFTREVDLHATKNKEGKFTFIFQSSNSPQSIVIPTNRSTTNNPPLLKLSDTNYKEYSYLSCGFKIKDQLMYDQANSYPLFLTYSED